MFYCERGKNIKTDGSINIATNLFSEKLSQGFIFVEMAKSVKAEFVENEKCWNVVWSTAPRSGSQRTMVCKFVGTLHSCSAIQIKGLLFIKHNPNTKWSMIINIQSSWLNIFVTEIIMWNNVTPHHRTQPWDILTFVRKQNCPLNDPPLLVFAAY